MVLVSAQLGARPERKDGGHPTLGNAPPQWLRMRHQSHQRRFKSFFQVFEFPTIGLRAKAAAASSEAGADNQESAESIADREIKFWRMRAVPLGSDLRPLLEC